MTRQWGCIAIVFSILLLGCSRERSTPTQPIAVASSGIKAETPAERQVERRTNELRQASATAFAAAAITYHADPSVFGTTTPVVGRLFHVVAKSTSGSVSGVFAFSLSADGVTTHYTGRLTQIAVYDFDGGTSNRAKIGGPIDWSDDPDQPAGRWIWWQQIDNARSPGALPDKSTFAGFGDEAATTAFVQSPNPPRFGPFAVDIGDIVVRATGSSAGATTSMVR
jgi:hypothetical protein